MRGSCGIPDVREVAGAAYLEVSEERVQQEIHHNERRKDSIQQTCKDEPRLQQRHEIAALIPHDLFADLAVRVEQEAHEAPAEVPLQRLGEDIAPECEVLWLLFPCAREASLRRTS